MTAAAVAANVSDNQTVVIVGAGLLLVVGGVWYLDYRARSVVSAVSDGVSAVINEESVLNPFYLGGLYADYANWVWGKIGSVGGLVRGKDAASGEGVL